MLDMLKGKKTHLLVLGLMAANYFTSDGVMTEAGVNMDLLKESLMIGLVSTFRDALNSVAAKVVK